MLKRIIPYTLKGFIYYQGESDDHKPALYYKLFSRMIEAWRSEWNDDTLPFIFVELPEHRYHQDRDFKNWCLIRECQVKTFRTVRSTAMVCASGLGQYDDIHPKAKKVLAERMADCALWTAYSLKTEKSVNGPIYRSYRIQKDSIVLSFDYAEDGFIYRQDEERTEQLRKLEAIQGKTLAQGFTGFELAGSDKFFYPAQVEFGTRSENLNTITLKSPDVPEPLFARYGWYNFGPVTTFGRNGLPLSPFRTYQGQDLTEQTDHADIQQVMEV